MTDVEWDRRAVEEAIGSELAAIVPGVEFGPHDNFFSHGGDSFGVVRFISGMNRRGLGFTARDFMQDPTPSGLVTAALRRLGLVAQQDS